MRKLLPNLRPLGWATFLSLAAGCDSARPITSAPVAAVTPDVAPVAVAADAPAYEVIRVIDGDTIVVFVDGAETTVRLIGVDTPETVHPQKPVEYFGKEASAFTKNLLAGEQVYLEYEQGSSRTDKYGRTLAYVYRAPDRLFVNHEIVRQGYGHAYTSYPFSKMESFRQAERDAREARKGLWGAEEEAVAVASSEASEQPMASAEAEEPPPTSADVTVYVTKTGSKYHRSGCQYLKKSKIPIPLSQARQGYGACSVCRPPN